MTFLEGYSKYRSNAVQIVALVIKIPTIYKTAITTFYSVENSKVDKNEKIFQVIDNNGFLDRFSRYVFFKQSNIFPLTFKKPFISINFYR